MHAFIVPGRAGAIVAVVIAGHVGITGEPAGVIVQALHAAVCAGSAFAAGGNRIAEFAIGNRPQISGQIGQQPVGEIHARQVVRHAASGLVDVGADAGHIRIMDDQCKAAGTLGHLRPGQRRIAVGRQRDRAGRGDYREGEFAGNRLAVGKGIGCQAHGVLQSGPKLYCIRRLQAIRAWQGRQSSPQ